MELQLEDLQDEVLLPSGFAWYAWHECWLRNHAEVKYRAFRGEIDSVLFPNLGNSNGCLSLMQAISKRSGFCPEATWLLASEKCFCGTIQGITDGSTGYIQNVGVVPEYRNQNLGMLLLLQSLYGFQQIGVRRVSLEVTAKNTKALSLYRKIGFTEQKVSFREVIISEETIGMGI